MTDFSENNKNLYVIKRQLAELKKTGSCFEYYVGQFKIQIFTDRIQEHTSPPDDIITLHEVVDINLSEEVKLINLPGCPTISKGYQIISLVKDLRFKDYQPIKYTDPISLSTGQLMPIITLCELCKYLHRLSNLSAFS